MEPPSKGKCRKLSFLRTQQNVASRFLNLEHIDHMQHAPGTTPRCGSFFGFVLNVFQGHLKIILFLTTRMLSLSMLIKKSHYLGLYVLY